METIGAISGSVLGYIANNYRGARSGAIIGSKLTRKRKMAVVPYQPFKKQRVVPYLGVARPRYYGGTTSVMVSRKSRRKSRKSLKQKIKDTLPAKHNSVSGTVRSSNLTHNTIYTHNVTAQVTQGDAVNNRDGDSIFAAALKVRGSYQVPVSNGGYTFRIMAFWSSEEYNPAPSVGDLFGSGFGTEIFHGNTANLWSTNGLVNSKQITPLYDETIDINTLTVENEELKSFMFTVPLNKEINYEGPGSAFAKNHNLYIVVFGSVIGGVTGSTNIGNATISYDLIFK